MAALTKGLFVSFLQTYPYFCFSLALFILALLCLTLAARYRKPILLCGLLAVPAAALEIFFVPDYWHPVRLSNFIVGAEDILFSFSVGIVSCCVAFAPFRGWYRWNICRSPIIKRYAIVLLSFLAGLLILLYSGMPVMAAALFSMLSIALVLKGHMRNLWPISATGALSFALIYLILMKAGFALWPHWLQQWNLRNLTGHYLFGVPLEEIAWAFLYGAMHPFAISYIFGFKVRSVRLSTVPAREIYQPTVLTAPANPREVR